jgi:hypothetical protein
MPWKFEPTRKTPTDLFGRDWCDFAWHDVRVPVRQPRPQHQRGLTIYRQAGGSERAIHCSPSRTSDGADVCPAFVKFRKLLTFPTKETNNG